MRRVLIIGLLTLTGCATQSSSMEFYQQETHINAMCAAQIQGLSDDEVARVNPETGRSKSSDVAQCYAPRIKMLARQMQYHNIGLVDSFADARVNIFAAMDAGKISQQDAVFAYTRAIAEFARIASMQDRAIQQQEQAAFISALGQIAVTAAEINASRPPPSINKPVICSRFGNNSVICN